MKNICVFCGSRSGKNPAYEQLTIRLGQSIAEQGLRLIYGGAQSGLMGVLAETILSHGGEVIGVMPNILVEQEIVHHGLTELHVVETMNERKQMMYEMADGFIALPGGTGTLDELSEILCLVQIGAHQEPIGLLDVDDFFTPWLALFDHMVQEGFLQQEARDLLLYETDATAMLRLLKAQHCHD